MARAATIGQMDSAVFEAFNQRNLGKLRTMFSEDLEFYHDLGGVTRCAENMACTARQGTCSRTDRLC